MSLLPTGRMKKKSRDIVPPILWGATIAVLLTWLAGRHPLWATAIVVTLVAIIVVFIRVVIRAGRAAFRRALQHLRSDDAAAGGQSPPYRS